MCDDMKLNASRIANYTHRERCARKICGLRDAANMVIKWSQARSYIKFQGILYVYAIIIRNGCVLKIRS